MLILEEPANGLDPEGIRWLRQFLWSFAKTGRTVLVSSHLLSEMELLADDLVIIAGGRLVTQGTVEAIVRSVHLDAVSVRTPSPQRLAQAVTIRGGTATPMLDGRVVVTGLSVEAIGNAAFLAGVELHWLATEGSDLERAFFALTHADGRIR